MIGPALLAQAAPLADSRQNSPAHGRVQGEHAPAVPHLSVAVLADDVVVLALGEEIVDQRRFALVVPADGFVEERRAPGRRSCSMCSTAAREM